MPFPLPIQEVTDAAKIRIWLSLPKFIRPTRTIVISLSPSSEDFYTSQVSGVKKNILLLNRFWRGYS